MRSTSPAAAAAWQFTVFPLVAAWQPHYWSLGLYFPSLWVGAMTGLPPAAGLQQLALPARQDNLLGLGRDFRPGELSQWQQMLAFTQDVGPDEKDLIQSIKGGAGQAPVRREAELDPAVLWTLDWQLESSLIDQQASLAQVGKAEAALAGLLAPDAWDTDSQGLAARWQDPGTRPPELVDPALLRLRLDFWLKVLTGHLQAPWGLVNLDQNLAAGLLAEAQRGQVTMLADVRLPACLTQAACEGMREKFIATGIAATFSHALGKLLAATAPDPQPFSTWVEKELWPQLGPPQTPAVRLVACRPAPAPADASDILPPACTGPLFLWGLGD